MNTIHKIVAVVIQYNKFLMVRKAGKDIWTSLGGKPEGSETEKEALLREIKEEFNCDATIIRKLGDFSAKAVFDDATVVLSTYLTELHGDVDLSGDPELEEYRFISAAYKEEGIKLPASIEEQIIPFCMQEGLLER